MSSIARSPLSRGDIPSNLTLDFGNSRASSKNTVTTGITMGAEIFTVIDTVRAEARPVDIHILHQGLSIFARLRAITDNIKRVGICQTNDDGILLGYLHRFLFPWPEFINMKSSLAS